MERPESFFSNDSGEKYVCPTCGGTGWLLTEKDVPEYGVTLYASRCPACAKRFRETDTTGMPLQYAEADLPGFNFKSYGVDMEDFRKTVWSFYESFQKWEDKGMGLYLCSETPGSGKTLLACSVARSISLKYDLMVRFITAADYLSNVGDNYHRDLGAADSSSVYRTCDLLVLDDLGAERAGAWQDQELLRLINNRIANGKVLIITSNVPQENLKLDARTVDRIISCTLPLALPEVSVRRKKAEAKQKRIVDEILSK